MSNITWDPFCNFYPNDEGPLISGCFKVKLNAESIECSRYSGPTFEPERDEYGKVIPGEYRLGWIPNRNYEDCTTFAPWTVWTHSAWYSDSSTFYYNDPCTFTFKGFIESMGTEFTDPNVKIKLRGPAELKFTNVIIDRPGTNVYITADIFTITQKPNSYIWEVGGSSEGIPLSFTAYDPYYATPPYDGEGGPVNNREFKASWPTYTAWASIQQKPIIEFQSPTIITKLGDVVKEEENLDIKDYPLIGAVLGPNNEWEFRLKVKQGLCDEWHDENEEKWVGVSIHSKRTAVILDYGGTRLYRGELILPTDDNKDGVIDQKEIDKHVYTTPIINPYIPIAKMKSGKEYLVKGKFYSQAPWSASSADYAHFLFFLDFEVYIYPLTKEEALKPDNPWLPTLEQAMEAARLTIDFTDPSMSPRSLPCPFRTPDINEHGSTVSLGKENASITSDCQGHVDPHYPFDWKYAGGYYDDGTGTGGKVYWPYMAVDIALPDGYPLRTPCDALILQLDIGYIRIQCHDEYGYFLLNFMHNRSVNSSLSVGTYARKGTVIGYNGDVGSPKAYHTHITYQQGVPSSLGYNVVPTSWTDNCPPFDTIKSTWIGSARGAYDGDNNIGCLSYA